jgi:hypothetical protein
MLGYVATHGQGFYIACEVVPRCVNFRMSGPS